MKTSEDGVKFIAGWEGLVLCQYKDCVGVDTVGYGHVVKPGEDFSGGVTKERALELLAADLAIAEAAVNRYVIVELTQNQFDALVSFTFNCGGGALKQSSTLRLLNAGSPLGAADALLLWCNAGGKRNAGLLNRRKAERAVFLMEPMQEALSMPGAWIQAQPDRIEQVLNLVAATTDAILAEDLAPHRGEE